MNTLSFMILRMILKDGFFETPQIELDDQLEEVEALAINPSPETVLMVQLYYFSNN